MVSLAWKLAKIMGMVIMGLVSQDKKRRESATLAFNQS